MPPRLELLEFDAVLFDVDGTLIDSLELIVRGLGDTYERFACVRPSREAILGQIGLPLQKQVQLYLDQEPTPAEIQEMTTFAVERFEEYRSLERPFPEAVDMLRLSHEQGVKTGLVTSKSRLELNRFMSRFEGRRYVDETVCASDVLNPKPHPESALLACKLLQVEPGRTVMVGDSVFDLQCARDAGLTVVGVTYGAGRRESLERELPDFLFDTPGELLRWAQSAFFETPCRERS